MGKIVVEYLQNINVKNEKDQDIDQNSFEEMWIKMVEYLHLDLSSINNRSKNKKTIYELLIQASALVDKEKKTIPNNVNAEEKNKIENVLYTIKQAILLRKVNLIGLKMRIYMERQKA